jgi:hypothetical protein
MTIEVCGASEVFDIENIFYQSLAFYNTRVHMMVRHEGETDSASERIEDTAFGKATYANGGRKKVQGEPRLLFYD